MFSSLGSSVVAASTSVGDPSGLVIIGLGVVVVLLFLAVLRSTQGLVEVARAAIVGIARGVGTIVLAAALLVALAVMVLNGRPATAVGGPTTSTLAPATPVGAPPSQAGPGSEHGGAPSQAGGR